MIRIKEKSLDQSAHWRVENNGRIVDWLTDLKIVVQLVSYAWYS